MITSAGPIALHPKTVGGWYFSLLWLLLTVYSMTAASADATHILVLGDSLSAGYGLGEADDNWVELLQKRLDSQHWTVTNASISGDTTAGGKSRLPRLLAEHHPDLVLLELGANDGLRGLSLEAMASNIDDMIRLSQQSGAQVMLLGMQLPPNYGDRYNAAFQAVYADTATRNHVPWMDFWMRGMGGWDQQYLQADGLHPNAKAQPLLLEGVWPALLPVLESLCGASHQC